jgi:hypothetical protein
MGRLTGAALAALLIAVLAAGCGGSSAKSGQVSSAHVSATAYVTSLCQAVAPFEKAIASGAKALDSVGSESAGADKAALATYFGTLASDSSAAASRLNGAGVPAVTGGSAFATAIRTTFTRVSAALSRSRTLAGNLPTSSAAAFETGADKLAGAVKTSLGQLGSGISTQHNQALNQAAAKVSACHTL